MAIDVDRLNELCEVEYYELSFGEKLQVVRHARGYTLKELENKTGLSRSVISGYELGRNEPGIFNLEVLCKALNIKASALLGF